MADELGGVDASLPELEEVLARDLPGGFDLGEDEREVLQVLAGAAGGCDRVLEGVEHGDRLFDLHAEGEELLLRGDERRLSERAPGRQVVELAHLLVDGLGGSQERLQGGAAVLLELVVAGAGLDEAGNDAAGGCGGAREHCGDRLPCLPGRVGEAVGFAFCPVHARREFAVVEGQVESERANVESHGRVPFTW